MISLRRIFSTFFRPKPKLRLHSPKRQGLSAKKQAQLEMLYYQLLSKKEFIASGKLQFLGLENIRKKMGKKWAGLKLVVYETAEAVINETIDKTDLYFSYNEDSYVILFVRSNMEESQAKITHISEEIRHRLFALSEDDLKTLEIKKALQEIPVSSFLDHDFPEILETEFGDIDTVSKNARYGRKLSHIEMARVNTDDYKPELRSSIVKKIEVDCVYGPLWEVRRGALTTYLCLLKSEESTSDKLSLDIAILEYVLQELNQMAQDGRKLFIMCPVHYTTLYAFDSYEIYKNACDKITDDLKPYLIFLVISPENGNFKRKDDFWFAKPLKSYASSVFAQVPLRNELNFQQIKNFGVDGIGIKIDSELPEIENIQILSLLASKAKYFKIPKTFALNIPSLSITTSLVCAGFDYLGGPAIHDLVDKPDTIHQYRYEDLLSEMIKS